MRWSGKASWRHIWFASWRKVWKLANNKVRETVRKGLPSLLTPMASSRWVLLKTILSFDKSLERPTELTENTTYTEFCFITGKGYRLKLAKKSRAEPRKRINCRVSSYPQGEGDVISLASMCGMQSITSGSSPEPWWSRVFIGVLTHWSGWLSIRLISVSSSSKSQADTVWPKVPNLSHTGGVAQCPNPKSHCNYLIQGPQAKTLLSGITC